MTTDDAMEASMCSVYSITASIPDSPGEKIVDVISKPRSIFTVRSYAGEELKKVLENDRNLKTDISESGQGVCETAKPRHPRLPIAPILKYYKILGPPRISAGRHKLEEQIPETDKRESENGSSTGVVSVQQNELSTPMSSRTHNTSGKSQQSRRIRTPDTLPELDQILEEEELYLPNETVSRAAITSTPTLDNTLPLFMGIKLLGMSME